MNFVEQAANAYLHQGQGQGQGQGPSHPPSQGAPHPQGQGPPHPAGSPHPPGAGPPGQQSRDPHQGLPPGWLAEWSAPDSRYYYVNTHTGERTWNRPGAPPPADPRVGLPPGWVAEWDAPDKRWFYVNTHTGVRQWDRPHVAGPLPPAHVQQTRTTGPGFEQQRTQVITQQAAPAAPAAKNHNMAYGAAGAVGGLAAGALLMHEGHKVGMLSNCNPEFFKGFVAGATC